jgi:hypothetical protein
MANRVFFLNTLHEGVDPAEYEAWIRRVDYPIARAKEPILSYEVTRLQGHLDGSDAALPAQYLEVVEITDLEAYTTGLATDEEVVQLLKEWATYVASSVAVHGELIV